jgi:hypothetical protein
MANGVACLMCLFAFFSKTVFGIGCESCFSNEKLPMCSACEELARREFDQSLVVCSWNSGNKCHCLLDLLDLRFCIKAQGNQTANKILEVTDDLVRINSSSSSLAPWDLAGYSIVSLYSVKHEENWIYTSSCKSCHYNRPWHRFAYLYNVSADGFHISKTDNILFAFSVVLNLKCLVHLGFIKDVFKRSTRYLAALKFSLIFLPGIQIYLDFMKLYVVDYPRYCSLKICNSLIHVAIFTVYSTIVDAFQVLAEYKKDLMDEELSQSSSTPSENDGVCLHIKKVQINGSIAGIFMSVGIAIKDVYWSCKDISYAKTVLEKGSASLDWAYASSIFRAFLCCFQVYMSFAYKLPGLKSKLNHLVGGPLAPTHTDQHTPTQSDAQATGELVLASKGPGEPTH